MIELTRLNGTSIAVNSDLFKTIESSPDTMLTLTNGEKLIVREAPVEVIERVVQYRARLLAQTLIAVPGRCVLEQLLSMPNVERAMEHKSNNAAITK